MKPLRLISILLLIGLTTMATRCAFTDAVLGLTITDAPIDDPLYSDIFITIDEIKLDGQTVDNFERKTLNISSLTSGITEDLFEEQFEAGPYEKLTFVLDYDKDDQGNEPGCYATTSYDRVITLANGRRGKQEIDLEEEIILESDGELNFVVDFDLRKAVRNSLPGDEGELSLVPPEHLDLTMRLVNIDKSTTISGDLVLNSRLTDGRGNPANYFVLYLYPRGAYDKIQEPFDFNGNEISYTGAVTSTSITTNLSTPGSITPFSMHYIEDGEYDLIVEAYSLIEFSLLRLGYLEMSGNEGIAIPVSVSSGQIDPITAEGVQIVD